MKNRRKFRSLIPGSGKISKSSSASETSSKTSMSQGIGDKVRQMLVAVSQMGAQSEQDSSIRKLVLTATKLARSPGKFKQAMNSMAETERAQIEEASTWLASNDIAEGKAGKFDACDLRNWLEIAKIAGVNAIPAREIVSFTAQEYEELLGKYKLDGDNPRIKRSFNAIQKAVASEYSEEEIAAAKTKDASLSLDKKEEIIERLYSAMDDIPEGWMVRASICGGNNLKALAGCGVTETFIPEVRFGPDLEVGPGWVRQGNRRRIDIQDKRVMDLYIRNDTVPIAFLARPWVVSSRWMEGHDPHRQGSPIDTAIVGKGSWPAEWRAFVRAGRVTGVSAYYSWAGEIDKVSAQNAIGVRELAQKLVDAAIKQGLTARSMDDVLMRHNSPQHKAALEQLGFMDGDFDATIDFIETENGLQMLEAGPGCGPFGSGHPCGFAGDYQTEQFDYTEADGTKVPTQTLKWMPCEGVAFRNMENILIGDPKSWGKASDSQRSNAILNWDEALEIAEKN